MSSGDSHTGFNANAFTVGAIGGAATIASALGAGWAADRAAQQERWAGWEIAELRAALDCSEALHHGVVDELRKVKAENAALRRAAADQVFAIKLAAAKALRARWRRSPRTPAFPAPWATPSHAAAAAPAARREA